MPSKQVTDREKSARAVLKAIEANGQGLAQAMSEFCAPYLKTSEEMPNFGLGFELVGRALAAKINALVQADDAHAQELGDDAAVLERRDGLGAELYSLVTKFREKMDGVFGAALLPRLGISGSTPQDPVVLSAFARELVGAVRRNPLPAPQDEDITYNPTRNLSAIETKEQEVKGGMEDVAREQREAQKTLQDKSQAMASYNETFARVTNFMVGAFRLVGMNDLADRVRPSTRTPGQTIEDAEPTGEVRASE
jgi:hypothetical protein